MSVLEDILTAIRTTVAGLPIAPVSPATVLVRGLPKVRETVDTLPCVRICASAEDVQMRPLSMEDNAAWEIVYAVDVVVIQAKNRDATFPTVLADLVQTLSRAFQEQSIPGVPVVFQVDVRRMPALSLNAASKNYAYSGIRLMCHTKEPRQ